MVLPSGAERATRPTPMLPDAPVTFSITTGWPSDAFMPSATMRAMVSMAPPAGTGTTMVIGRDGKDCAKAESRQRQQRRGACGPLQELAASNGHDHS